MSPSPFHLLTTPGLLTLLALAPFLAAVEIGPYGSGFRGDGSGVFPDSAPPVQWDAETNIRWTARLPNWGYSCPVPIGGRVYFVSEPFPPDYWPQLCCFDDASGALLWKRPIDPRDAFPELSAQEREGLLADIQWVHDGLRATYRICHPLLAKGGTEADDPAMVAINEQLAAHGVRVEGYKPGYGLLRKMKYLDENRRKAAYKNLGRYGIAATTTWQNFGAARVGTAFPTPVGDGEALYVMTRHGTVASFAPDGALRWSRSATYKGHHGLMASPRLYGDLLLTGWIDTGNFDPRLLAWDRRKGELVWEADIKGGGSLPEARSRPGGALVCMTVGETPVVLCSSGRVVRLPDGKVYDVSIPTSCGTYAVDDEHDVVFGCGHDDRGSIRWAFHLRLEGEALVLEQRWARGPKSAYGPVSAVFVDRRLFIDKAQIDPATGAFLDADPALEDARKAPRSAPQSRHLLLAAGGHVYGLQERKPGKGEQGPVLGVCEVYSYDGKKVAENVLPAGPWDEEATARWQEQGFGHGFSYSCSMNIAGDRIYLCSQDRLYCIGER